ncbi:hypothetical protein BSKO_01867 [Bryopsis sp. KO-2023]|nr:hypothetical protein BSKO_01867 [Bryopsis sp. KO-2023]
MQFNLLSELKKLKNRTTQSGKDPSEKETKKKPSKPRAKSAKSAAAKSSQEAKPQPKKKSTAAKESAKSNDSSRPKKPQTPFKKRLKDAITALLDVRVPMSIDEICAKTKFDPDDKELWLALGKSPRTELLPDGRYLYKSQLTNVREKGELLTHVRKNPRGTVWMDIRDAYQDVERDLKSLVDQRQVFVLHNPDMEDDVVYPNSPTREKIAPASGEVVDLWQEIQVPHEPSELEDALRKAKIEPSRKRGLEKRAVIMKAPKKAKKKDFRYRKVTNTHMPELFNSQQPDQID